MSDTIEIIFNRDSVCMGDDCMSHTKIEQINPEISYSELLSQLSLYVPSMKSVVWAVQEGNEIIGFIETDDDVNVSVYVNGDDVPIGVKFKSKELFCRYYYSSIFMWIDGKTGEQVNKYAECSTLLEKVKKANGCDV